MGQNGLILSLAAGLALVLMGWNAGKGLEQLIAGARSTPTALVTPPSSLTAREANTIEIFEATRESVVFISVSERVIDPWRRRSVERSSGTGSGFFWDDRGHVVTNWHVLEGADRAAVRLADGRSVPAQLVGAAPVHDLAVLRVDVTDAPYLSRATEAELRVGQSVLAIGNPFGLDWTLTNGIISALERDLPGERDRPALHDLIQTDAAINPGNSGGPLLDSQGRLIGVNTAIFSPSGSSAGIGFAVPVDRVARVVPQLIATGQYRPPGIGIETDARVNRMAARQGIEGVLVLGVVPGSAAETAGLEPARMTDRGLLPGDRIMAVGDQTVAQPEDLTAAFDTHAPGDTLQLSLQRGQERRIISVTLEEAL